MLEVTKRGHHFIRVHNETLSVVAMCAGDPDCVRVGPEQVLSRIKVGAIIWRNKEMTAQALPSHCRGLVPDRNGARLAQYVN